jgi:hypothetical protein
MGKGQQKEQKSRRVVELIRDGPGIANSPKKAGAGKDDSGRNEIKRRNWQLIAAKRDHSRIARRSNQNRRQEM